MGKTPQIVIITLHNDPVHIIKGVCSNSVELTDDWDVVEELLDNDPVIASDQRQ